MPVENVTLRASAALTGAGTTYSDWFEVDRFDELVLFLRVTAQGTYTDETLDITLQTKDPAGNAYDLTDCDFTQVGDVTGSVPYSEYMALLVFGAQVRLKYITANTTPNYTFSVIGYGKRTWR